MTNSNATSKDEFFKLLVTAAKLHAETAAKRARDEVSLQHYGMDLEARHRFLNAIRSATGLAEFKLYLEQTILESYQYLLSAVDGITAFGGDSRFRLVDKSGVPLGEDLHLDFAQYMRGEAS